MFVHEHGCVVMVSDMGLNTDHIDQHIDLAQQDIDSRFGLSTFCGVMRNVTVQVVESSFRCNDGSGRMCDGESGMIIKYMTVTLRDNAMLHEVIHFVEWRDGILNTGTHPEWKEKRYEDMDRQFKLTAPFLY